MQLISTTDLRKKKMLPSLSLSMSQLTLAAVLTIDYRNYPNYSDNLISYHTFEQDLYSLLMCLKTAGCVANNVDPEQTPQHAAPVQGLHCLHMPVCPNIYGK